MSRGLPLGILSFFQARQRRTIHMTKLLVPRVESNRLNRVDKNITTIHMAE